MISIANRVTACRTHPPPVTPTASRPPPPATACHPKQAPVLTLERGAAPPSRDCSVAAASPNRRCCLPRPEKGRGEAGHLWANRNAVWPAPHLPALVRRAQGQGDVPGVDAEYGRWQGGVVARHLGQPDDRGPRLLRAGHRRTKLRSAPTRRKTLLPTVVS
jgi:hypothetical protein